MSMQNFLGVRHPIVQAPMAGVQNSRLAIAVCNAGGLGGLPCAMLDAGQLQAELQQIKAATSSPFNVNFFCHTTPEIDNGREQQWRQLLAPFLSQYNIKPENIAEGGGRSPFNHHIADVIEPFKPAVVSFHFGLPEQDLLNRVKAWGATVLSTATTVKEALWLEANGADAIIAQGLEAGGHRGMFLTDDLTTQIGTFALLPQIVKAVKVPVVAAGGISDRSGVQAALALGAAAVQVGTAFLLCDEASTSQLHRNALKSDDAIHSAITNVFSGRPARGIVNKAMRAIGPINTAVPDFPFGAVAMTAIRNKAEAAGCSDFSPLWCGQNSAGCREVSARELIQGLI